MLKRLKSVPRGVWALGFVSMFMDVSSEMIHALLPVFLVGALGASAMLVGVIEGVAEATTSIVKLFSGRLSDRLGRRKMLVVIGYGLAALSKPVFPLAVTPFEVLGARFVDRVGKGVRDAPRDALIADLTNPEARGAAYGLRQSLDTVGAFIGPMTAIGLMVMFANDIRAVFAWAVVPAVIAVMLLVFTVKEPQRAPEPAGVRTPIRWREVRGMGAAYWTVVGIGSVFTLARFSEAFLILRAQDAGLAVALVPLVLVIMNMVYAAAAAPAGGLSDRIGRKRLLIVGLIVLVGADAVLAVNAAVPGVLAGVALWGLHMGLTQGVLAALVADAAPIRLRGTAFGVFNLTTGITLLAASLLAGALWSSVGAPATFAAGGLLAFIALFATLAFLKPARAQFSR